MQQSVNPTTTQDTTVSTDNTTDRVSVDVGFRTARTGLHDVGAEASRRLGPGVSP